jgi:hypothetical protein
MSTIRSNHSDGATSHDVLAAQDESSFPPPHSNPDSKVSVVAAVAASTTTTTTTINKENSPNGTVSHPVAPPPPQNTANNNHNNHTAASKRPMTTDSTAVVPPPPTSSSSNKKIKPDHDKNDDEEEGILDLAVTLGYRPGDRFLVQWEIDPVNDEDDDDEDNNDDNDDDNYNNRASSPALTPPPPVVKWWGATLQEFDGRSEDCVAIRVLKYDPCPELGFAESSLEDVIFMGDSLLVSPDSSLQLNYKREGGEEEDSTIVRLNENDMDEQLNAILMGALAKNEAAWKSLPPAQQAVIAEKIQTKKEELLKVLRSKKEVITSATIKDILRETFGGAK